MAISCYILDIYFAMSPYIFALYALRCSHFSIHCINLAICFHKIHHFNAFNELWLPAAAVAITSNYDSFSSSESHAASTGTFATAVSNALLSAPVPSCCSCRSSPRAFFNPARVLQNASNSRSMSFDCGRALLSLIIMRSRLTCLIPSSLHPPYLQVPFFSVYFPFCLFVFFVAFFCPSSASSAYVGLSLSTNPVPAAAKVFHFSK